MTHLRSRWAVRRLAVSALTLALFALVFGTPAARAVNSEEKKHSKSGVAHDYALIFGTVWSSQNHPAYGIRVKIRRADQKKAKWELVSDHNGEFAQRVPAGTADYLVWAEVPNRKGPVAETKVHIENDERTDIGLHLTE